jgi:thiamine biosynthesis lipoprotein
VAEAPLLIELDGPTMGTRYAIKFAPLPTGVTTETFHEDIREDIRATLERINKRMSTYDPDSELSGFNGHEGLDWFEMSSETISVISTAVRISELTDGAFDITVGPLVDLWGFGGKSSATSSVPSKDQILSVRNRIGFRHLEIREAPPALRRTRIGLEVDLSGIAKGYAVDQIAEVLEAAGIDNYMVEVGGEIRARGLKPTGEGWRLGIEAPLRSHREVHRIIELADEAMATSGDYRNYFQSEGNVYSHLLDPRTGYPIKHRLASASVIADKCIYADALATALMVLGPEEGYRVALEHKLAVLWMLRQGGTNGASTEAQGVTQGDASGGAGLVDAHSFIDKTSPAFEQRTSIEGSPE